eukprot:5681256-Prymnesium_polylepis.1
MPSSAARRACASNHCSCTSRRLNTADGHRGWVGDAKVRLAYSVRFRGGLTAIVVEPALADRHALGCRERRAQRVDRALVARARL